MYKAVGLVSRWVITSLGIAIVLFTYDAYNDQKLLVEGWYGFFVTFLVPFVAIGVGYCLLLIVAYVLDLFSKD